MSAEHLADVVRWVGVVVAFVASFLAAPTATRRLVAAFARRAVAVWTVTAVQARRVWARLTGRKIVAVHAVMTGGRATGSGQLRAAVATGWSVGADDDLPARVTRLEQRVIELRTEIGSVRTEIAQNAADHREAIAVLGKRLTDEVAAIERKLAERAEEATRVDASALPVLGLGIVLSGVPDYLATWTWLGVVSIVLALSFLQWALMHFWATAPEPEVAR